MQYMQTIYPYDQFWGHIENMFSIEWYNSIIQQILSRQLWKTSKIEEILSMKVYRVIVANIVLIGETVHYERFHNIKATMLR